MWNICNVAIHFTFLIYICFMFVYAVISMMNKAFDSCCHFSISSFPFLYNCCQHSRATQLLNNTRRESLNMWWWLKIFYSHLKWSSFINTSQQWGTNKRKIWHPNFQTTNCFYFYEVDKISSKKKKHVLASSVSITAHILDIISSANG